MYRVCCDAAHPGLAVWRRFGSNSDSDAAVERLVPPASAEDAAWFCAVSSFHLVTGAYCLTNLGDPNYLKLWWEREVAPLLGQP